MTRYDNALFEGYDKYDYVYVYMTHDGTYFVTDRELSDTYDETLDEFFTLEDYGYVGDLLDNNSTVESWLDEEY